MKREYAIHDGKIEEVFQNDGCISVYENPDDAEKAFLVNNLLIDEHTLNSALDPDELPRLEFEPTHLAIIFKKPKQFSGEEGFVFHVLSLGIFFFKDKLVIVSPDDIPLFDGKLFFMVKNLQEAFLKALYRIIYHYNHHLRVVNMMSDSLEGKINESLENKYLINLFGLEKSLVYYLNAIRGNDMVMRKIKNFGEKIGLAPENIEMLDDIIIENDQCYRQAEIYSNILAGLMDARVSIVSNNLNVLMKKLNIVTIAIMVPTLVVSVFSMNVTIPLSSHPLAFWMVLGVAIVSVAGFFCVWKYKKW